MREYLQAFLNTFSYEPEDQEFLLSSYDRIAGSPEAMKLFRQALALYSDQTYQEFHPDIIPMAEQAGDLAGIHPFTSGLLVFLCLTEKLKDIYIQNGLSLDIYRDTVEDLRYKMEECKLVRGIVGTFVVTWFRAFFSLKRFALGRLQFEVIPFDTDYTDGVHTLTPGTPVINVHIPRSGKPLDPESCEAAYRMARDFYREQVPSGAFVCSSWLLFPENKNILSPTSNVYRFLCSYTIIHSEYYRNNEALWRLFDTDERNPARLPTNGSMRRGYAEHLKKGGKTGWGMGVLFR